MFSTIRRRKLLACRVQPFRQYHCSQWPLWERRRSVLELVPLNPKRPTPDRRWTDTYTTFVFYATGMQQTGDSLSEATGSNVSSESKSAKCNTLRATANHDCGCRPTRVSSLAPGVSGDRSPNHRLPRDGSGGPGKWIPYYDLSHCSDPTTDNRRRRRWKQRWWGFGQTLCRYQGRTSPKPSMLPD
ncbi:hypothetical protein R1flu_022258 [Riccia fluitans]|uniref:Uncharacterized protein n=1 Tax=Riccia fluitans TaxID=41844 RepID=A0ABD1ZS03_9MARC